MRGGGRHLGRIFELISFIISSNSVSAQAQIGDETVIYHHGVGVVIHEKTIIGHHCKIFQNVTIGQKIVSEHEPDGVPIIGNYVTIGAGACLLGNITIGDHAVIGANAVVTRNVAPYSVVVGVPGREIDSIRKLDR